MNVRDLTFEAVPDADKMKLFKTEHKWKHFTKGQRSYLAVDLNYRKLQAKKLLKEKQKNLEDEKKRARSHSRSKSSEP